MSGIGFIIPNSDFSNSPLGSVTIIKTNKQLAQEYTDAYATAIGTDEYNDAIYKMALSILNSSLWDKTIAIYPILGDTVAKQTVALKGENMNVFANASRGDNKLVFTNDVSIGPQTATDYNRLISVSSTKRDYGVVFRANCTVTPTSGSYRDSYLTNFFYYRNSTSSGKKWSLYFSSNSTNAVTAQTNDTRIAYTNLLDLQYVYANGELVAQKSQNNGIGTFRNMFGCSEAASFPNTQPGETISQTGTLFKGTLSYFVLGYFNQSDIITMDRILKIFEEEVGKV